MISYFDISELSNYDITLFAFAFIMVNAVKPWINLLWIVVLLMLPNYRWKSRIKKSKTLLLIMLLTLLAIFVVEWYGQTFRVDFSDGRMLGNTVDMMGQLSFVLHHIPRTFMVLLGTLYENTLYLNKLGTFGALDLEIPLIGVISPMMLTMGAALNEHESRKLTLQNTAGWGALALIYIGGVLTAQYITYTPVGMVRVLGVQVRYLLPAFLILFLLLSKLFSRVRENVWFGNVIKRNFWLIICVCFALLAAVLLAQHYYIGPVCIVP